MAATHYEIIDRHTGKIVAIAKTRATASRMVDRRDNAYGAYRYSARPVYAPVYAMNCGDGGPTPWGAAVRIA